MECLFGITGADFCILAADTTVSRSIVMMKPTGELKFRQLTSRAWMAFSGEPGDAVNYAEYIQRNIILEAMRWDGRELDLAEVAAFARKALADALRSRTPYAVNVLIGGVDRDGRGRLFWMDYLASLVELPFGAQGYGAYFCSGLLDRYYRAGLDESEALDLLKKCLAELKTRFVVNLPQFSVRIIRRGDSVVESLLLDV